MASTSKFSYSHPTHDAQFAAQPLDGAVDAEQPQSECVIQEEIGGDPEREVAGVTGHALWPQRLVPTLQFGSDPRHQQQLKPGFILLIFIDF